MVANYVSQFCGVDEVWLMPSPLNPFKVGSCPVSETGRLEMCRIVAEQCSGVKVSDFEFDLPRPTYTCRTLLMLRDAYPDFEFSLVIGSDNWLVFDRWRDWETILDNFGIIIYPRPGYDVAPESLPPRVRLIGEAPQALISSTFVRSGLREGKNMNFFIDPKVFNYIRKNHLYDR